MTDQPAPLTWDVYVTALEPTASDDPPPGAQELLWQPTSATLISGQQDAVLVDPLLVHQARDLADWVAAHGKNLTAVYVTHGHGDHWFGLRVILERFPQARALALPAVIEAMRQGSTPEALALWNGLFPGKIPQDLVLADPLPDHTIELEDTTWSRCSLGTPTPTTRPACRCPRSAWWSPATPSTTTSINTFVSPAPRAGASGSPPSTPSNRCTHAP